MKLSALPKPAGIRRAWDHNSMTVESTGLLLRKYHVGTAWGNPVEAEAWFDENDRLKVCRAIYANGKFVTLKLRSRDWQITFSTIPDAMADVARQLPETRDAA